MTKPLAHPKEITVETRRADGARQSFLFSAGDGYLEATAELPEPHEFDATLTISHGDHAHTFDFKFSEADHHHHHGEMNLADGECQDAHERAHASDIAKRFSNRTVSTGQIVMFGLTGGLMPCPAAFTALIVCLQLKKFALGFTLVLCFSVGLAITMVTAGVVAAWGAQHASKRIKGFGEFARKAPYISSVVLIAMGLFFALQGWRHLP